MGVGERREDTCSVTYRGLLLIRMVLHHQVGHVGGVGDDGDGCVYVGQGLLMKKKRKDETTTTAPPSASIHHDQPLEFEHFVRVVDSIKWGYSKGGTGTI